MALNSSFRISVNYLDTLSENRYQLPAVYTRKGILVSHLRYLAWYSEKSHSWKEKSVLAIRLLIEYIEAVPEITKATPLLKSFTQALVTGTINYETSNDPLGLFWRPRDLTDANSLLFHITSYTDFLAKQDGYDESLSNPFREASSWEARMNWCAYYHKHANVFLNHLSSYSEAQKLAQKKRLIYTPLPLTVSNDKAERFPEDKIDSLINEGFKVRGRQDYRSQAIAMLMNFGGLRKSEIFHLYVSDITVHPTRSDEALVRIYHPVYGSSPDPKYKNRNEYLKTETSYLPRTQYRPTERLYSGWKNPLLTSREGYFEVVFCPTYKAKEFLEVWANYLKFQRVEPKNQHPFAFTNNSGEPETVKNFQRRHKRAVERIGLEFNKAHGTTEHGHRHSYGYRARSLGLTQIEIQKAMHHKSPNSCLIYIKPTNEDIRIEMKEAEK